MLQNLSLEAIPLFSVAAAMFLVYLPMGVVGYARARVGYDVSAPRAMFDRLPPYGQRATWAHENGFETFGMFAAAALIAYITGPHLDPWYFGLTGEEGVAVLCGVFLVARLLYNLCYIADIPIGRSLSFLAGSLSTLGLLLISLLPLLGTGLA
ncbi:MAPEG family protein [Synechococcus sp. Nb3U1]|uniref:MAPEG family protein n=1 Tax=Synechococcus sp. Nb3U1 TaxID=1914529 RepID=UPI001F2D1CCD|nr:MAPEG family protein [Synechococcus sp. Nb3U1]MCF2970963.1 MAPEG family protein [Synechococcus sp. Nb3U1]